MDSTKKLADEALALAPKFERLPQAIYQALDNHNIKGDERARLFGEILSEFKRRKDARATAKKAAEQIQTKAAAKPKPNTSSLPPGVTAEMLRDAIAHELSQPADTYDTEAEERVRKPLHEET